MARSPLIIDSPMGRLYVIDLGSGASMLMIEMDGQAMTYPFDDKDARRIASYLRAAHGSSGPGRPPGMGNVTDEELQQLVTLYNSDEAAAFNGVKADYVAQQLGLSQSQVYSRLKRAKNLGMVSDAEAD